MSLMLSANKSAVKSGDWAWVRPPLKRPIVFLIDHKGSTCRLRFDPAHELGHLVMHVDLIAGCPELDRRSP
jgi:Zn-dependent peptidase ImmA (M78 family)